MNNIFNAFLLRLFLWPKWIYWKLDADLPQLKAILTTKLIMDDRRATGLYKASGKNTGKEIKIATLITMLIAFLIGIMLIMVLFLKDDLTRLTFYFTALGFMLALFLITDFSYILLDARDNEIILPKPVHASTFMAARILHILIHVIKIILPLSLPGFIVIFAMNGWYGALLFVPSVISLILLTFAMVNAAYLLIIRVFSVEKLNSIIASVQIIFSIILYAGFQLLPRMFDESILEESDLLENRLVWIVPTFWIAAGWKFFYTWSLDPQLMIGSALSIVVPLIGLWMVFKYLAPAFLRKLSMMNAGVSTNVRADSTVTLQRKAPGSDFVSVVAKICTTHPVEREAITFVWRMTGRYREFKLKVYPQVGYLIVLFILLFFGRLNELEFSNLKEQMDQLKFPVLVLIYLSCFIYLGAVYQLSFHEKFKAGWIFFSAPLDKPGHILRGAIKACLMKFVFPIALVVSITLIAIFDHTIIPNLLFGYGNVFLICVFYSWLALTKLPFTISSSLNTSGRITVQNVFMIVALPMAGLPHYFLFDFPIVLCLVSIVTFTAAWLVLQYKKNISWSYINSNVE